MTLANQERLSQVWMDEYDNVRSQAQRMLRDPAAAEDVAMQAFVKLGERMERGTVDRPAALLQTLLHGLTVDLIRSADARPKLVPLEDADNHAGVRRPFLGVDQASLPSDFNAAVRGLPEPERDAFILTELRGLTVREAAEVMDTSKSSVDRLAQSALTTIREELAA